jgi:hypothetical protein
MTDEAAHGYGHADGAPIDAEHARLLRALATKAGRTEAELLGWLPVRFGIDTLEAIPRVHYGAIVGAVASPGPLPLINSTAGPGEG